MKEFLIPLHVRRTDLIYMNLNENVPKNLPWKDRAALEDTIIDKERENH